MKSVLSMAIALILAGAGTGLSQSRPASKPAAAKPASKAGVEKTRPADAELEALIRAKLDKSPKLGPEKFQVHVQGGVATLEGKTDVVQHKGTATRMAKTAGALAVNNHIQVSDAGKQKMAGNLESGRRRVQVKRGDARSDTAPPKFR
jgi:hypothetical protein